MPLNLEDRFVSRMLGYWKNALIGIVEFLSNYRRNRSVWRARIQEVHVVIGSLVHPREPLSKIKFEKKRPERIRNPRNTVLPVRGIVSLCKYPLLRQ